MKTPSKKIQGVCLPPRLEGLEESPSKVFLESTMPLLPSLDICKQGTIHVSVCLLASNDRDGKVKLKGGLTDCPT